MPGRTGLARAWLGARVVLALGAAFGVAATMTDAAWTDQELAKGSFTAGTFVTQSSVDTANPPGAGTWNANSTTPATLSFNATAMIPGTVVRAPLAVRAAAGSVAGKLSLAYSTSTGSTALLAALQFGVYLDTSNICATSAVPDANGSWIVGPTLQTGLTTAIPTNTTALAAAPNATTAGAPDYYCLIVSLPSTAANALQGTTATATWVVNATT
jgi:predicted ribosomally synthesized peptide with SipW-like signal peptide